MTGPEAVAHHLNRLAEALFPYDRETGRVDTPASFDTLRGLIEARVLWGEVKYGDRWLSADLIAEALEECADLIAYSATDAAVHDEADVDLSLTATRHAYLAAEALMQLRSKRLGTP